MISYKRVLFFGISGLVIIFLAGWFLGADLIEGQGGSVEVTATVGEVTCSVSATSTAFGPLRTDQVSTSTPNIVTTMACADVPSGCILYVKGTGSSTEPGLWNSVDSYLIASADATLEAGTEGYGIQAAKIDGDWTIDAKYDKSGNVVGGLTIADSAYASHSSGLTTSNATTTHKAAISTGTTPGSYEDTITYSCTVN